MPEKTEERPLSALGTDHIRMKNELGRKRGSLSALRLQTALRVKSNGRLALVNAALLIGTAVLFTTAVFSNGANTSSNSVGLLVTIAVFFSVISLGIDRGN